MTRTEAKLIQQALKSVPPLRGCGNSRDDHDCAECERLSREHGKRIEEKEQARISLLVRSSTKLGKS